MGESGSGSGSSIIVLFYSRCLEAKLILDAGDWAKLNIEESSELFVIILFFWLMSLGAGGPKSEKWFV